MDTVKKSITRSTASKTFGANPISVYSATHSNTLQENFVLQLLVWIAGESAHFSQFSKSLADVKSMLNSQAQDLNYQEFVTKHTAAVQILYDSSEKQDAIQWERVSDLCNDVALVLGIKMSNEDSKILKIDDLNTDTASSSNIVDLPLSNGCKKLDLTKELFFHILYLIAKPCTNISEYMKVLIETLSQFGPCKISLLSLMQQSEQAELQTFLNNCLQHESFEKLLGKLDDRENVYTSLAGIFQKQFIAIFWDIENCQVPRGVSAEAVVSKLRNKIFDGYQGIEIIAACSEKAISSETRNELHQSGVRLIDVAEAVSEKLKDFKELPISWEDFLDDLPKNTKKEPRKKKKEPCRPLISVSNLPAEHDVKEIRNKLNKLTSAHGGKVQKICRTAEIAFSTKEMAERAKQALDGEKVFDSTVCAKLVD
ncbi:unnamed protein product [Clavelina lepadiformis]|uniref:Uncharacterized protein n=1 Tax=Clavelina lepadiformis TaxID=159417 RepID=A0ABP0FV80_CLALP